MAITPYLYYEDVAGAMRFLAKAFGFRRFGPVSRGPDRKINHAAMKAGGSVVLMGRPPTAYRNPRHLGQATQCLLIDVRSVDAHFRRAVKAGPECCTNLRIRRLARGGMASPIRKATNGTSLSSGGRSAPPADDADHAVPRYQPRPRMANRGPRPGPRGCLSVRALTAPYALRRPGASGGSGEPRRPAGRCRTCG